MVKLKLYVGRTYDGYGEQVVQKEEVCMTNIEASHYLTQLVEEKGVEATRNWIKRVKGEDVQFPKEVK
jgi:hypothetical protein